MTTAAAANKEEGKGNSLGAIWETVKGEKTYLTGDVMGVKVVLVPNPKKKAADDTQPKFLVYPLQERADTHFGEEERKPAKAASPARK